MIDWAALKAANAPLGAFVDWDEAQAGAAPDAAGPLAGLTLGVKANIMVAGLPWTAGMGLHRRRIAPRDAAVVARLRRAGATVLGTLNMHEAALGAHSDNAFFGRTHNPHRLGFTPGGSSGGSGAAVAAGLCDLALGTDTLGSVRIPAAYCGVYGLKPSHGAVDSDGLAFLEPSLDCIGPLAASLDRLEQCWRVMVDAPGAARHFRRLVLLDDCAGVRLDPAVAAGYARAGGLLTLPREQLVLADAPTTIRMAGLVSAGRWLIDDLGAEYRADNPALSAELRYVLSVCAGAAPQPEVLMRTRDAVRAALGDDGVLLMPTAPQTAFAQGARAPANQADFTALASIAGLPALALPAGWSSDGLPVGVQLVGPPGSEASLIALGRQLDAGLGAYHPPIQRKE